MNELENKHILGTFENALQNLRSNAILMASLAERNLNHVARGVFERDDDLCKIVIADDEEIDSLEIQIDRMGVEILMRFQPVASDLRDVIATMKFSSNIERIADQTVNIARRARKLNTNAEIVEIRKLESTFRLASVMFKFAIQAYADRDVELARSLKAQDRELDKLNNDFSEFCTEKMAHNPTLIPGYLNLIFISRFLERVGDHATNMAEDTVFAVEAEDIRHLKTNR